MIFVTGATGHIGAEVVRELALGSAPYRLGLHHSAALASDASTPPHQQQVPFDFLDASSFAPALLGCTAVFLLRPPAIANTSRTLNVFLDVARQQGVTQVVFVSVAGAGNNPLLPHHAVEQHLKRGPAGWTIFRPGFFAQNLGDAYQADIVHKDCIFLPAGQARVAFVDARDIAEVAVNALLNPAAHRNRAYDLTGPAAYSFADVAQLLSTELDRLVVYQTASVLGYFWHLRSAGLPVGQALLQTVIHVSLRLGQADAVSTELAQLLGHDPYSLAEYIHDHRQLWQQD
jgi:uncharacterized protein YbjT (DUF2867 family)